MKKILLTLVAGLLTGCIATPTGKQLFVPMETVTADGQTNIVYVVNPGVTGKLDAARGIVQAVPTPWSHIAAGALAVASAVLGVIAKVKSNKAALLPAVIAGVEAAANAETKLEIKRIAMATGVEPALHREVQRLTQ